MTDENLDGSGENRVLDIAAFILVEKEDGIQIQVGKKIKLHVSPGLGGFVIGTVKIDGQVVPVTDMKAKKSGERQKIDKNCYLLLEQRNEGKHIITKGALYEDTTALLEIIGKKL